MFRIFASHEWLPPLEVNASQMNETRASQHQSILVKPPRALVREFGAVIEFSRYSALRVFHCTASLPSASILRHSDSVLTCAIVCLQPLLYSVLILFRSLLLLFSRSTVFCFQPCLAWCRSGLPFVQEFLSFCVLRAIVLSFRPRTAYSFVSDYGQTIQI